MRKRLLPVEKKTWRTWLVLSLASVVALAGYLAFTPVSEAIAAGIIDPLALLALRSPGHRGAGSLTQTKVAMTVGPPELVSLVPPRGLVPTERVLTNVRSRPPIDLPIGSSPIDGPVVPPGTLVNGPPGSPNGIGFVTPSSIAPASGPFVGNENGGVSSGGGGLGGGGPGSPGGGGPVSSVPEPATWLTMVVGFFGIGSMLRAVRRKGRLLAQTK